MKKSISTRFRVTKTGKVLRRAMAQGHFLSGKTGKQLRRKHHLRGVATLDKKIIRKFI